jgi:antitoxin (DNA-binding transcriptional repressor) of toxin-antitoxin stability system
MSSATILIREIKSHLSALLRRVKAGDAVVIVDQGESVGRSLPLEGSLEESLRRLGEAGVLAWSGRNIGRSSATAPAARGDRSVSELLLADRR